MSNYYSLHHITTGDILREVLDTGIITEMEGNLIWTEMIRRKRKLPTVTFSDYFDFYYILKRIINRFESDTLVSASIDNG